MSLLVIQKFIFLKVCCLFTYFVFQFQMTHKVTISSNGKNLKAKSLTVPGQG